ncbi:hypothetical protein CC80DRAFT_502961 [Byssothecium circinans]|uniref:Uncharacterized protein n=1 Tax=Byssothecium circinans TaxID=147558 RepID=A0A6A5U0H6_9PLEO|nr:hypothetical protein CC80DRAFT_502961 [Byssothecium circinans]
MDRPSELEGMSTADNVDKISQLGSSALNPIELHVPMYLRANTEYWFSTPGAIQVQRDLRPYQPVALIAANAPVMLRLSQGRWITSKAPLGCMFEKCWSRLPDELKLRVLRTQLVQSLPVERANKAEFYHYLKMTPEIAALSKDIYYKENTFNIGPIPLRGQSSLFGDIGLCGPALETRPFVHHLTFTLGIDPSGMEWRLLKRLANGEFGYTNLVHVEIQVPWDMKRRRDHRIDTSVKDWSSKYNYWLSGSVEFPCALTVGLVVENDVRGAASILLDILEHKITSKVGAAKFIMIDHPRVLRNRC